MDTAHFDTSTYTPLRDPWLTVARAGWIAVVAFALVVWGAAVVVDFNARAALDFTAEEIRVLQFLGLSTAAFPLFTEAVPVLLVLLYLVVAGVLFWRKSDDRGTLLISLSLTLTGIVDSWVLWSVTGETPVLFWLSQFVLILGFIAFGILVLIFPDGRFVPRWTRWVPPILSPWLAASVLFPTAAFSLANTTSVLSTVINLLVFCLFVYAQVYRYRNVSTPVQRQQTKWAVFGFTAMFVALLAHMSLLTAVPVLLDRTTLPGAIYKMYLEQSSWSITYMIVPLAIGISMLHYRLWDIDFVINRSLVYGGLTVALGAIFAGGFFAVRAILEAILGGQQAIIAAAVSGGTIVGLFTPTRRRLRRLVDRRFYGIEIEYQTPPVPGRRGVVGELTRTHLGDYTGLEPIGRGGMAEVYRAQHPTLNRPVAVKILPQHLAREREFRRRFEREAQVVARLKHPNIVQMHDFGEAEGMAYMVMEYIEGRDLGSVIRDAGRLPLEQVRSVVGDIAAALDYAHQQGLVHRDIKPSNVMLEPVTAGGGERTYRAVLMDFGIARIVTGGTRLTRTGMVGTLDYVAPEQIQAASEVDGRADVYSLGVMTYQMATGELPFQHNNPGAMLMAHLMQPPPDPRDLVPDLPAKVAKAIRQAMAKEPEARFTTAGELFDALGN